MSKVLVEFVYFFFSFSLFCAVFSIGYHMKSNLSFFSKPVVGLTSSSSKALIEMAEWLNGAVGLFLGQRKEATDYQC